MLNWPKSGLTTCEKTPCSVRFRSSCCCFGFINLDKSRTDSILVAMKPKVPTKHGAEWRPFMKAVLGCTIIYSTWIIYDNFTVLRHLYYHCTSKIIQVLDTKIYQMNVQWSGEMIIIYSIYHYSLTWKQLKTNLAIGRSVSLKKNIIAVTPRCEGMI